MTNSETDIVETNPAFRSISAEEEFFKKEVLVAIRTVKQNLLPIQKEILDMKENFENDFQISKKLGIPYSKVRKHLECIRSELSKLL
jgi:DNA-directed RNA polymerase specialized sigma24 family protein